MGITVIEEAVAFMGRSYNLYDIPHGNGNKSSEGKDVGKHLGVKKGAD